MSASSEVLVMADEEPSSTDLVGNKSSVVSIQESTAAAVLNDDEKSVVVDKDTDEPAAVLGSDSKEEADDNESLNRPVEKSSTDQEPQRQDFNDLQEMAQSRDPVEDSMLDPLASDPSCDADVDASDDSSCWAPPKSTIETENIVQIDATCTYGGEDPSQHGSNNDKTLPNTAQGRQQEAVCTEQRTTVTVDKHWGSDQRILRMRDQLRQAGGSGVAPGAQASASASAAQSSSEQAGASSGSSSSSSSNIRNNNQRPPIFLLPGLAATRLVAWKHKPCLTHPLLSDIKIQDIVWLNINLLIQMGTIDVTCMKECMKLGINQTDFFDTNGGLEGGGCKLRSDEGLDAISSLAPGGLGSKFLVGGTNTVYAWLIQWLADNLGYDVGNIIGLPYDWRLSPEKMEARDGFLTLTRRRIEAAVKSNGQPGIMVAHSMGNAIFRYFLEWLRQEMREEAYAKYIKQAERRAKARMQSQAASAASTNALATAATTDEGNGGTAGTTTGGGWMLSGPLVALDEWWNSYFLGGETGAYTADEDDSAEASKHKQLWELAQIEGDEAYFEWLEEHIWTYVGLSAPLLGAVNPLRSVISGENMGLPITDEAAREMEVTFGCTHTVNPISSKMAFCDQWEVEQWDEEATANDSNPPKDLFCLDDLMNEIESSRPDQDPWADFPVLKNLLKDRVDWDSAIPMMSIVQEKCKTKEKSPCKSRTTTNLSPRDAQNGNLFDIFHRIWKEENEPLVVKRDQLSQSWWQTNVPNILNKTWDRPHIKHIIMAYGVDLPTEVGYVYKKVETGQDEKFDQEHDRKVDNNKQGDDKEEKKESFDGIPSLERIVWEESHGALVEERLDVARSLTDTLVMRRKAKREPLENVPASARLQHSGDGTVPYLSLSWAHTWLLHAIRAKRHSQSQQRQRQQQHEIHQSFTNTEATANVLQDIHVSHRPKGAMEWVEGPPARSSNDNDDSSSSNNNKHESTTDDADTGTAHPHGTKYKPEMVRFSNVGTSRKTGMTYSTTVLEAIGVEHKETTRNYDILAAVFTSVLRDMHDDFGIVQ